MLKKLFHTKYNQFINECGYMVRGEYMFGFSVFMNQELSEETKTYIHENGREGIYWYLYIHAYSRR